MTSLGLTVSTISGVGGGHRIDSLMVPLGKCIFGPSPVGESTGDASGSGDATKMSAAELRRYSLKPEQLAIHISDNFTATMVKVCKTLAELEGEISAAGHKLVVVHFFAKWCAPECPQRFKEEAKEEKEVIFLEVDIDVNKEAAEHFKLTKVPLFMFIKGGAKVDEVLGAHLGKIKKTIKKHAQVKDGQWNDYLKLNAKARRDGDEEKV